MFFTWMVAAQLWSRREDMIDPFREEETAVVTPLPKKKMATVPHEPKALVA